MPNTSTIAFALVVGFIVFITVRGELPLYLCVVGIGSNCPAISTVTTTSTGGSVVGGVAGAALKALPVIAGL